MNETLQHHAWRLLQIQHKHNKHLERLLEDGAGMNIFVSCKQWSSLEKNGRKLRSMLVLAQVHRQEVMLKSFLLSFRRKTWVFKKYSIRWTWTISTRACFFQMMTTIIVLTNSTRLCLNKIKLCNLLFHVLKRSNHKMSLRPSMSSLSHLYVHHKMTSSNQKSRIIQRVKFS